MAPKTRQTDTVLILSALAISYCIWLIARMGNVEEEIIADVPVVLDIPSYIEANPTRKTVGIEVRYPKSLRKDIHSGAFEVVVDDRYDLVAQAGIRDFVEVKVALLPEDVHRISLPQSVQVGKVDPNRLSIPVRYRSVRARVVPNLQGSPAPGYRLREDLTTGQLELRLTGSQAALAKLSGDGPPRVLTRPIELSGRRETLDTSVAVLLPESVSVLDENEKDPAERLRHDAVVALKLVIEEEVTSRTIEGVSIRIAKLSRSLEPVTEPTTGTVVIEGPRSRVEAFDRDMLTLEPKSPPEESPGFVGKIAIEARRDASYMPDIRILSVRPDSVLLRYRETATSPTVAP